MSMNISGLGNAYNSINTNSKQYKALKEKGWLSGVIENESMMSPEEKMIYEIFGGRDTIIKNLMKQFDSDGDLLNSNGVAGMDVTGKGTSWQKLTNISEDHRQKMFDNVKREFIQKKGGKSSQHIVDDLPPRLLTLIPIHTASLSNFFTSINFNFVTSCCIASPSNTAGILPLPSIPAPTSKLISSRSPASKNAVLIFGPPTTRSLPYACAVSI